MAYGKFYSTQAYVVGQHIRGQEVHDLGAGDLELSQTLLEYGATKVIAVDRSLPYPSPDPRIVLFEDYFHNFHEDVAIAFVSWPCNWQDLGLVKILRRTPKILYLGQTMNGTMCGGRDFWEEVAQREVLAYEPMWINSLIVYGPTLVKRALLREEAAGMDSVRIWDFQERSREGGEGHGGT